LPERARTYFAIDLAGSWNLFNTRPNSWRRERLSQPTSSILTRCPRVALAPR